MRLDSALTTSRKRGTKLELFAGRGVGVRERRHRSLSECQPAGGSSCTSEVSTMLDPVLLHLHQAKQSAQWFAQLMQLDPELMIPAALPLVAARLMDAGGVDDDGDDDLGQPTLAVS